MKINNELGNNSVLWQQVQDKKKSDKGVPVSDDFSRILQNMREYKPANYDDTIKVDDKTTVTTQVLSDGSTLKTPATSPEKNPTVVSTETIKGLKQEDDEQPQAMTNPDAQSKLL